MPFEDNKFDRIVSNNVLYTLRSEEWESVITELKRVCKPQGVVLISNLNRDFRAVNIYKDHIAKSIERKGFFTALAELIQLFYPTIQMLRFNRKINRNNVVGEYSFIELDEQKEVFENQNFKSIFPTELVYADQANLNVFVNRK
ncbi:MAG: class I SAM-dependent methyltransferase [Saprospiraceae bacterium]|nr:class I SAM-dependent methyltransferase [Saprospiraceae bacterium]